VDRAGAGAELSMPVVTVYNRIYRGWLTAE
jgi:hypothetical protein